MDAGSDLATTAPTEPVTKSAAPDVVTTTTSASTTSTTAAPDPSRLFSDALAASSGNYKFLSTVSTGEETVTTIEGVVDNESISATITAGTGKVSYVRTPEGEWIAESDGEWVAAEGDPPAVPPLGSLTDTTDLTLMSSDAGTIVIEGKLGNSAGDAVGIPFTIRLVDGHVTEVGYQAQTAGGTAMVTTVLTEIGTAGEVAAPPGV